MASWKLMYRIFCKQYPERPGFCVIGCSICVKSTDHYMVLSTSKSESMGLEIKKWRWESFFSLLYLIVSSIFAVSYFVIDILPQTYSPHNWLWGNFAIRDKITSWQSGLTHAKQKYEWWWILILKQITTDEKEAEGLQGTELNPQIPWNFRMFINRHGTIHVH